MGRIALGIVIALIVIAGAGWFSNIQFANDSDSALDGSGLPATDPLDISPKVDPALREAPPVAPRRPLVDESADRRDCNAMRGTDYRSVTERIWFLSNCITQEPVSPATGNGQIPVTSGSDLSSGCNPASYATFDDFRCGGTGDPSYTDGCNPAPYATFDDFRCGGTGDPSYTDGCNPASYATYDDFRCGGTGDPSYTDGCNPAPYATYDDFRCGGN